MLSIGNFKVTNPNFGRDLVGFLNLKATPEAAVKHVREYDKQHPLSAGDIAAGEAAFGERLTTYIDRREFIEHLRVIAEYVKANQFKLAGKELVGVHWDIAALRLYLSITLIDIFHTSEDHKRHYEKVFAASPADVKKALTSGLSIINGSATSNNLRDIADYFYNIRNYYTHAGRRFHVLEGMSVPQLQPFIVGSAKHKSLKTLRIAPRVNVVDLIIQVANSMVNNLFAFPS
jgi:hypothetical protein